MDPNETVRMMDRNDAARTNGEITQVQWRKEDRALRKDLRDWRDRGGFAPRGGWPRGL